MDTKYSQADHRLTTTLKTIKRQRIELAERDALIEKFVRTGDWLADSTTSKNPPWESLQRSIWRALKDGWKAIKGD